MAKAIPVFAWVVLAYAEAVQRQERNSDICFSPQLPRNEVTKLEMEAAMQLGKYVDFSFFLCAPETFPSK